MFSLDGKCALVTGASGSIGGAIARALHAQGAKVAISGTRIEALEQLADSLGTASPGHQRVVITPGDLAQPGIPVAVIEQAEKALGGQVDILVNNAGLTRDGLSMRMKSDDWQAVLQVNLTACFQTSQAVLRGMIKRRWGRIIAITSIVAAAGNLGQANYAAAKAGLTGMSKCLAMESAARGVTVNCVAPGMIESPMVSKIPEAAQASLLSRIPARRAGSACEVAAAVAFLSSDEAAYVTGQTLHINGGMLMV